VLKNVSPNLFNLPESSPLDLDNLFSIPASSYLIFSRTSFVLSNSVSARNNFSRSSSFLTALFSLIPHEHQVEDLQEIQ
jgi:hypothetical protein